MLAGCPAPCGFAGDEAGLASHHARGSEAILSVLRRMPDVQNFNGIAFYAIGDDMWQPPVQEFACAFLAALASAQGKLLQRAGRFADFNNGGPC